MDNDILDKINDVVSDLFDFVVNDKEIYQNYSEHCKSELNESVTQAELQLFAMEYILNAVLPNGKNVISSYIDKHPDMSEEDRDLVQCIAASINSTFEVIKLDKHGFKLLNVMNERQYNVISLRKMQYFRGIVPGQFIVGRVMTYKDITYLVEISSLLPSAYKQEIYRNTLVQQLQSPELIYLDNPEKLSEIEGIVTKIGDKFNSFFVTDEVITISTHADALISAFNDYFEDENCDIKTIPAELIEKPDVYSYFELENVESNPLNPIESALQGFSAQEQLYDVGIVFDKDAGLLVLPFYDTFKQIFLIDDYKSINGYKECVLSYLENDKVPDSVIKKVYESNPDKFLNIVKEVTADESISSLDAIIDKYKANYKSNKIFSALTVLYASNVFEKVIDSMQNSPAQKIGRNDPCICGSGKKYKKCCMNK